MSLFVFELSCLWLSLVYPITCTLCLFDIFCKALLLNCLSFSKCALQIKLDWMVIKSEPLRGQRSLWQSLHTLSTHSSPFRRWNSLSTHGGGETLHQHRATPPPRGCRPPAIREEVSVILEGPKITLIWDHLFPRMLFLNKLHRSDWWMDLSAFTAHCSLQLY